MSSQKILRKVGSARGTQKGEVGITCSHSSVQPDTSDGIELGSVGAAAMERVALRTAVRRRTDGGGGHELLPQVVVAHEVRRAAGRLQQVQLEVVEAVRPAAAP